MKFQWDVATINTWAYFLPPFSCHGRVSTRTHTYIHIIHFNEAGWHCVCGLCMTMRSVDGGFSQSKWHECAESCLDLLPWCWRDRFPF